MFILTSRYDYMWEGNTTDVDGEAWPDPLSIDYNSVLDNTKSIPSGYTLTYPDTRKLWVAYYKATGKTELDDVQYTLNGIEHVGLLEPGDEILLFDTKLLKAQSFHNLK